MKRTWTIDELRAPKRLVKSRKQKKIPPPPTGMNELAPIIANMARDIKIIRRAQDIESAKAWANDFNTKHNTGYEAAFEDLNNDNIPELVVRDKNADNALITVNGYTTVPSTWPDTLQYGTDLPYDTRRKMRKDGKPYPNKSEWNRLLSGIKSNVNNPFILDTSNLNQNRYNEFGGVNDLISKGYKIKTYNPNKTYKQSAYQVFNKYVFMPTFNGLKQSLFEYVEINKGNLENKWNYIFPTVGHITKSCGYAYQTLVVDKAIKQIVSDEDLEQIQKSPDKDAIIKRIKTKSIFKYTTVNIVQSMINEIIKSTTIGDDGYTTEIINKIYSNNPMFAELNIIHPASDAYKELLRRTLNRIKQQYDSLIAETNYNTTFGSPVRPKKPTNTAVENKNADNDEKNPNEVADEMQDDRDNPVAYNDSDDDYD